MASKIIAGGYSVQVTSDKNNVLNRSVQQSNVLDQTTFAKIVKTVKASVYKGTERSRKSIDQLKTVIVANNKRVNSKAASLSVAIPLNGTLKQNMLDLVNRGVFFALAPQNSAESSSSTKQRDFSKLLKVGLDILGTRKNSPLVAINKLVNIKYQGIVLEEEGEFESDDGQFFQLLSSTPMSKQEAGQMATEFVENAITSWDGAEPLFGFPPLAEYLKLDAFGKGQSKSVFIFIRHETSSYVEYFYVPMNVKITEEGNVKSTEIKKSGFSQELGARVEVKKIDVTKLDKKITRAILEAERAYRQEGITILEYGHLISAGQVALLEVAADLDVFITGIDKVKSTELLVNRLSNLRTTLQSIIQVAIKLDGIIESWGSVAGPDVMGLDRKDILAVLGSAEYFDPGEIYIYEKVDGIVARKGSMSRIATLEVEMPDGTLETTKGPLVGLMERAKFNNAKGAVTKALFSLLKKQLEGDMERALTQQDVLTAIGVTGHTSTASDSILSATVKYIFGLPIDKGKGSKFTLVIKTVKQKLGQKIDKLASIKPPRSRENKKPLKDSDVGVSGSNVGRAGILTSSTGLAARLNLILKEEITKSMSPPKLQNRTGRFAGSAEVTSINDGLVSYRYMYSPYQVFSKQSGTAPWNSVSARDPDSLIISVINRLLASYTPGVSYSYARS
jgi:hypothetical protein